MSDIRPTSVVEKLVKQVSKLQTDPKWNSAVPRPGFIPVGMGGYRRAEKQQEILTLLNRAIELQPDSSFLLLQRGSARLSVQDFDAARHDANAVRCGQSRYVPAAISMLISIALAVGDRDSAKRLLDELSALDPSSGRTLKDFELFW